ncbi:uncharacterized protein AMSG_00075 [Thecamonas trahens ATCC 50062]|uniref:General transcription factor TFIIB n=1 Tax=Thecamonas trahens ATCC 50062 TaxID=461836 RepID=A0A0L0D1F0_THETB|nr:hypothetical protein AMSG_00075 [Thecamonas trahens ATCC 50062]KNC45960.1 hypothetical protein AMSG_00075 [Thecamonas trahens ATCC 50062]|eukprot:XP_013762941.1 hypothetical protein AMSG_00075 [Thecamonas trahens ATCC 50062]
MRKSADSFDIVIDRTRTCSNCKTSPANVVEDFDGGMLICRDCGMVFREAVLDYREERRSIKSDDGNEKDHSRSTATNNTLHTSGLGTVVGKVRGRAFMTKAEKQLKKRKQEAMPAIDRLLLQGNDCIRTYAEHLQVPPKITDIAQKQFKEFVEKMTPVGARAMGNEPPVNAVNLKPIKNKNTNLPEYAAVALLWACRLEKVPRTLKELHKILKIKQKKIRAALKAYRNIAGLSDAAKTSHADYLGRYVSEVGMSHALIRVAQAAANNVKHIDELSGKRPQTISAGIIMLVATIANENISVDRITATTGVAATTVTKTHQTMVSHQEQLLPRDFLLKYGMLPSSSTVPPQ